MDFDSIKVKGFNLLAYTLVGLQIAIVLGIAAILLSAISNVAMTTTVSVTVMFLLGLPLLVLLYKTSGDRVIRTIFLGMIGDIALVSMSGITWYVLADGMEQAWLVDVAKVLMVLSYVPIMYALFDVLKNDHKKVSRNVCLFIIFLNLACSATILYYAITHLWVGKTFDITIYTLSTLGDIIILAQGALLIVIYSSTRLRYLLSIVFGYMLLSLAGDSLNLIAAMKVGFSGLAGYPDYFYDAMLLFLVAALLVYSFFKDMKYVTVEEMDKKLNDTRHAMDDLITQMPDAACIFSPAGGVVTANEMFFKTFGVARADVVGRFNLFGHFSGMQCGMGRVADRLKNGETIVMDRVEIPFRRGLPAFISFKIFPTFSQDGGISGYIAICEDVTDRVKADRELKQAKDLGELYIDLMSHDINNMNQVGMGFLELAIDTLDVTNDKKMLLAKPLEAMENSSRLIDNVKKLRRASEGGIYLRPVNLGEILKGVIAEHGQAPGRDVAIRFEAADGAMVMANELLKDVFANLVSNAIKHSSGAVRICIDYKAIEAGGKRYYRVTLEDDGPGIPEELKPVIFDRALRGRARIGGNGLGLYLVKTLIDNYGGSIVVEDRTPGELKRGTRFIVTLPAA